MAVCSAAGVHASRYRTSISRLTAPMLKQGGEWKAVDWTTALEYVARGLTQIKADHGAQSIGALGSAHSTVEELHLLSKTYDVERDDLEGAPIGPRRADRVPRRCQPWGAAATTAASPGLGRQSWDGDWGAAVG